MNRREAIEAIGKSSMGLVVAGIGLEGLRKTPEYQKSPELQELDARIQVTTRDAADANMLVAKNVYGVDIPLSAYKKLLDSATELVKGGADPWDADFWTKASNSAPDRSDQKLAMVKSKLA